MSYNAALAEVTPLGRVVNGEIVEDDNRSLLLFRVVESVYRVEVCALSECDSSQGMVKDPF